MYLSFVRNMFIFLGETNASCGVSAMAVIVMCCGVWHMSPSLYLVKAKLFFFAVMLPLLFHFVNVPFSELSFAMCNVS